jgi:hypothetical protein
MDETLFLNDIRECSFLIHKNQKSFMQDYITITTQI